MVFLPEPYASLTDLTTASQWILYSTESKDIKEFVDNANNAIKYLTYAWHYLLGIKSPLADYIKTLIDYVEELKKVTDKDFDEYKVSAYVFLNDLAVLNVSFHKIIQNEYKKIKHT